MLILGTIPAETSVAHVRMNEEASALVALLLIILHSAGSPPTERGCW